LELYSATFGTQYVVFILGKVLSIEFIDSNYSSTNNIEYFGEVIDEYDNLPGEYYLTGRLTGHTVNIGQHSIVKNENGKVENILINDTHGNVITGRGSRRQILNDPGGRSTVLERIDAFRVYRRDPTAWRSDGLH
jgi:hypothetical protein